MRRRGAAALTLDRNELAGINDFLEGLKDPIYKTRLAEIEGKKKELEALIATAGKVKEIDSLNSKARGLKEGLDILVRDAQADRDAAKTEAAETRKKATSEANARIQQANDDYAEREMEVVSAENELKQGEEELAKDQSAFDATITKTNRDLAEAKGLRTKYLDANKQLREAMDRIAGAL